MKQYIIQLSENLFQTKIEIEKELREGNKSNAEFYLLILKTIEFLKTNRRGDPVSKKLPIYKYFQNKYQVNNLYLIKLTKEARALYTYISQDRFKILQIVLEIHETHKEYEKKGGYSKH